MCYLLETKCKFPILGYIQSCEKLDDIKKVDVYMKNLLSNMISKAECCVSERTLLIKKYLDFWQVSDQLQSVYS